MKHGKELLDAELEHPPGLMVGRELTKGTAAERKGRAIELLEELGEVVAGVDVSLTRKVIARCINLLGGEAEEEDPGAPA